MIKKNNIKVIIIGFIFFVNIKTNSMPKILCTAALIDNKFELRKKEYIKCFKILSHYGYIPYIVDSCEKTNRSFLHYYSDKVFYANTNNLLLRNKGVNEAKALLAAFNYFKFDDDDIIVKMTGRYHFKNNNFLRLVEQNPDVDAFVRQCTITPTNIFTGCFALKYKYFKHMIEQIDYNEMEKKMICIETKVAEYIQKIQKEGAHIIFVESLYLSADLFFDGINIRHLDI